MGIFERFSSSLRAALDGWVWRRDPVVQARYDLTRTDHDQLGCSCAGLRGIMCCDVDCRRRKRDVTVDDISIGKVDVAHEIYCC